MTLAGMSSRTYSKMPQPFPFRSDIINTSAKAFIISLSISNLFLNEFILSCPNTSLLILLLRIPLNHCFASVLETLETSSKDIVTSPLLSKIHLFSMKHNRFFAKRELPILFRCNVSTPKCSSLMLLYLLEVYFSN